METERATYEHDSEAVDEVAAELQDGVRCVVQCNLEPGWRFSDPAAGSSTYTFHFFKVFSASGS